MLIRLRVLDPASTAERIARLLNAGKSACDVTDPARSYHIVAGGKVVAESDHADRRTHW